MGSPIGIHSDGSNCYTVNCSLQGHSPLGMSKDAFINTIATENAKAEWDKENHILKNVNAKFFTKVMEDANGRWQWSEEDRNAFMDDVMAEVSLIEAERFTHKGRMFKKEDIPLYAGVVFQEAEARIAALPRWAALANETKAKDATRRAEWNEVEDITKTEEFQQQYAEYERKMVHYADWKQENLKTDMGKTIARIEDARYRRSVEKHAPSYMPMSFNPNICVKPKKVKKYVEFLLDEAYIDATQLKHGRDITNGEDIVRSSSSLGGEFGTSIASTMNIVS